MKNTYIMNNPFKRLNPGLEPPGQLESGIFKRLSFLKLMLNFTKMFTSDMIKTGAGTIDGMSRTDRNRLPGATNSRDTSDKPNDQ